MVQAEGGRWPQYAAAIAATLSLAATGAHIGWTSPTLPTLKALPEGHPLRLSSGQASWIASLYLLGSLPGNALAAPLVDRLGRRRTLLLAGLPLALSWLLLALARRPWLLCAARLLAGLGQGLVYVCCPVYIGEIAEARVRGRLGSLMKLMVSAGELYARALGPYVSYGALAWGCLLLPLGFLLAFGRMPESPYFLLTRARRAEAEHCLRRLRAPGCPAERLQEDLDQLQKAAIRELGARRGGAQLLAALWANRRAALVCLGLQLALQLGGLAAVESYTQEILESGGLAAARLSAPAAVIGLSAVQLLAGLGAAALVDRVGRRPLLLATALLAGLCLGASAAFFLLERRLGPALPARAGLLLVGSVVGYELAVSLGLSPLPYLMLGELFPVDVKGAAVSLANLWASLLAFVVSKMHQVVADAAGIETSFACYAAASFLGLLFIFFCVPETKGKSLLQIQEELRCGSRKPKLCAPGAQSRISTIA
ncbi:facilitated trehalose transporter Tret1-like [Phymastichus coffea]|uniref:facilitated trehalose transporter Tret1-like n=1 Tax=Phymastichus coffea TaxID=108790 RepID=UPI00273C4545|nr:facilitated trehalose transporter Tret1-like [Phymastichus coffea]